ncbi:MAG TPA: alpha/beta hydrolase [Anaerolineae bacterium]|nr:alpha/beta hydrolase [Anaerolineae bacterium]
MPELTTSRLRFYYEQSGAGPQSVMLVHGSFASSRWWQPTLALLPGEQFTCYAPDLPGCGRSDRPDDPASYAVEGLSAALADLLDGLGLWDVHLVGHSLGAAVALSYAVAHPGRLRSLTLVSTPSPQGTPTPPEGYALLELMRSDRGLLVQALASVMPAHAPDPFFQQLVDDAQGQAPAAFSVAALALEQWRLDREDLQRLRLPVLLVWGDRDQIVERAVQTGLLLSIPGANNLEVLRGCGHTPMLERPAAFVQVLLNFIGQDFAGYAAIRETADSDA